MRFVDCQNLKINVIRGFSSFFSRNKETRLILFHFLFILRRILLVFLFPAMLLSLQPVEIVYVEVLFPFDEIFSPRSANFRLDNKISRWGLDLVNKETTAEIFWFHNLQLKQLYNNLRLYWLLFLGLVYSQNRFPSLSTVLACLFLETIIVYPSFTYCSRHLQVGHELPNH